MRGANPSSDIAFTASVKAIQSRRGSREAYARMEARGGFQTKITPDLVVFLAEVDTAYLATANAVGQPLRPTSWGPEGLHLRARRDHFGVCGLRRQSSVRYAWESG